MLLMDCSTSPFCDLLLELCSVSHWLNHYTTAVIHSNPKSLYDIDSDPKYIDKQAAQVVLKRLRNFFCNTRGYIPDFTDFHYRYWLLEPNLSHVSLMNGEVMGTTYNIDKIYIYPVQSFKYRMVPSNRS